MQEKHSTTEENIRISKPKKRDYETCTKRKFQMKNQTNDWKVTKQTLSIKTQTSKRW